MRLALKKRLHFFALAIVVYSLGFQFIPEILNISGSLQSVLPLIIASFGYFIFLPIMYWLWVIKAGKQKPWRMILVFSLSSLCARYSFPTDIALYFEFIMFLKYPIIGIFFILEFYLLVTIVKGLWQARSLAGDPRVNILEKYKDDEKKRAIAISLAWEPASWYYAISRFSRNHLQSLCQLKTHAATRLHWSVYFIGCFVFGALSYSLLVEWSELAAIIVSSLFFYSIIFTTANYRVARYYSIYITDNKLVINSGFWGFIVIELEQITTIEQGEWHKDSDKEQLLLGKGKVANIEITFANQQTYLGMLGQMPESIDKLWLNVDQPEKITALVKAEPEVKLAG